MPYGGVEAEYSGVEASGGSVEAAWGCVTAAWARVRCGGGMEAVLLLSIVAWELRIDGPEAGF